MDVAGWSELGLSAIEVAKFKAMPPVVLDVEMNVAAADTDKKLEVRRADPRVQEPLG